METGEPVGHWIHHSYWLSYAIVEVGVCVCALGKAYTHTSGTRSEKPYKNYDTNTWASACAHTHTLCTHMELRKQQNWNELRRRRATSDETESCENTISQFTCDVGVVAAHGTYYNVKVECNKNNFNIFRFHLWKKLWGQLQFRTKRNYCFSSQTLVASERVINNNNSCKYLHWISIQSPADAFAFPSEFPKLYLFFLISILVCEKWINIECLKIQKRRRRRRRSGSSSSSSSSSALGSETSSVHSAWMWREKFVQRNWFHFHWMHIWWQKWSTIFASANGKYYNFPSNFFHYSHNRSAHCQKQSTFGCSTAVSIFSVIVCEMLVSVCARQRECVFVCVCVRDRILFIWI